MYDLGKLEEKIGKPRHFSTQQALKDYLEQLHPSYQTQYADLQKNNASLKQTMQLVVDKVRGVMQQEK